MILSHGSKIPNVRKMKAKKNMVSNVVSNVSKFPSLSCTVIEMYAFEIYIKLMTRIKIVLFFRRLAVNVKFYNKNV